ncbi:MAG: hypothetical protein MK052_12240, partial [Alphaproteobacteria bacterium]|nr:hypothetical protein [Alphaproteobacteria bacterium]
MFSISPEAWRWKRTGRLLLAIMCGYLFVNLALHMQQHEQYADYEACLESLAHLPKQPERHAACAHHVNIADGASNVFLLYLGWLPALMIAGWWKLLWRRQHRNKMISLRKGLGDDRIANLIISLSYYMTLLLLVIVIL